MWMQLSSAVFLCSLLMDKKHVHSESEFFKQEENNPSTRRACVFEISFVAPVFMKLTQHGNDLKEEKKRDVNLG